MPPTDLIDEVQKKAATLLFIREWRPRAGLLDPRVEIKGLPEFLGCPWAKEPILPVGRHPLDLDHFLAAKGRGGREHGLKRLARLLDLVLNRDHLYDVFAFYLLSLREIIDRY